MAGHTGTCENSLDWLQRQIRTLVFLRLLLSENFLLNLINNLIFEETSHFHQFSLLHHQSSSFAQMFPWSCWLQRNRPRKQLLPRLTPSRNCLTVPAWLSEKHLSAALQTQALLSHSTCGTAVAEIQQSLPLRLRVKSLRARCSTHLGING